MPLILIVEDEEPIRVLAESILIDHDFDVLTAANADEAFAILDGDRKVDLLFTDIDIGSPDGIAVAQGARDRDADLPVVYTTGAGVTDGTRALFVSSSQFLPKPYRLGDLVSAIETAFADASDAATARRD